jgi:histone H2A
MTKKSQAGGDPPPKTSKAASGGAAKGKKVTSKSSKAGLTFPVPRINRRMIEMHKTTKRVGAGAPIFVTSVVEYFTAELLECSINQMKADGKGRSRITAVDVLRGLRSDPDLHKATNGLRVMVGDKQKNAADMIICKSDLDKKHLEKMQDAEWFTIDPEHVVDLNFKRYLEEKAERDKGEEGEEGEEAVAEEGEP